jgi:hypothetical protein
VTRAIKLFVVDTGPLITLAAAGSLDYLTYVQVEVIIPDAVLHEATRDAARIGAQDIIDWVKAHRARVEIAPKEPIRSTTRRARAFQRCASPTSAGVPPSRSSRRKGG